MELKEHARNIRVKILKMLHEAGSGHTGGSLGMADIFSALYYKILNDPHSKSPDRDRFILSNGHICPVWYATLAEKGFIPEKELMTLRKLGSRLQGHPAPDHFPFAEVATGSLGQGISVAVGLALGLKLDNKRARVFVGMGDGELEEGSCWEAFMAAAHYKLDNLIVFLDRNFVQQGGKTEEMMSLEPLAEKIKAFNWDVTIADGHNFDEIVRAFTETKHGPTFIIFNTHMGQGVDFILDDFNWHGVAPNDKQYEEAMKQL